MHTFDRSFFHETSVHTFTADVSELQHGGQLEGRKGLPRQFTLPGVGNGQPFVVTKVDRDEDDLRAVEYTQMLGCCKVLIFND